jgi:hypothetical protein
VHRAFSKWTKREMVGIIHVILTQINDRDKAMRNYEQALYYANLLPEDGYLNMIKEGLQTVWKG